jgi:hypothetical protein
MHRTPPALPRPRFVPAKYCIVYCAIWLVMVWAPLPCSAQATKSKLRGDRVGANLIRPEYYAALDLIEDGQTEQAIVGLDAALQKSRASNNQRGIDSIPPLVMMGECFWMQGRIGLAMEQYDAALSISVQCSKWTSMLVTKANGKSETRSRDIDWGAETRRGAEFWNPSELAQIPLAGSDAILELAIDPNATGRLVAIDAMEVLRCQALAIRRRNNLLGSLVRLNPLSPALPRAFILPNDSPLSDAVKTSVSLCRALAKSLLENAPASYAEIKGLISLPSGQDHSLSAVALLALCDQAILNNDLKMAEGFALEASLVAAHAGQMEHLDEAIELWSKCVVHSDVDQTAVVKILQQVAKFGIDRRRLVGIRSQVELVRQLSLRGESVAMKKQAAVARSMLLSKQILLPKMEAQVEYATARIAFSDGDIATGIQKLDEALIPFIGDSNLDVGSPMLYQLRLLTRLMNQGIVPDDKGLPLLGNYLQSTSAGAWRTHVLEQLAFQTADKTDSFGLIVQRTLLGQDNAAKVAVADLWFSERFKQASVLNGRLLEFRYLANTLPNRFNESVRNDVVAFQKKLGNASQSANQIRNLTNNFTIPNKLDTRRWSEEDTKKWDAAKKLSAVQETQLWTHAISPLHTPVSFPPRLDDKMFNTSMKPDDAVLLFLASENSITAMMRVNGNWASWVIAPESNWKSKLQEIVLSIRQGLPATQDPLAAALEDFRRILIPDEKWNQMLDSSRWVIVPDDDLWLFPFEVLLEGGPNSKTPVIANHPITYLPTLGSAPLLMQTKPSQDRATVLQSPNFLASRPDAQKNVGTRIAAMTNTSIVDTAGVQTAIPSRLLKIISPVLVSCMKTSWSDPNNIVLGIDSSLNESTLASWNQLPWGAPKYLWLMGAEFRPDAISSTGDAWRKLILSLAAQGTEQMMISRWSVGGESAAILVEALRDYGGSVAWSEAWQRAVANLWAEELGGGREVTLAKDADSSSTISGELPLYWSGYLTIGDSRE